ncbi:MAG: AmmeMemoRadiSam system radical SAM enzyme, partial [Halanaeroarchaeum sp.]
IKGFDERDHVRIMGGRLEPSLRGAETLYESDVHVELTYLTIPDLNDDPEEIQAFVEWARDELSPSVPLHFSRFHPDHEMRDRPPTPVDTLEMAHEIATDAGMEFVYVGNVPGPDTNSTRCPDCGRTWIRRSGFQAEPVVDLGGRCGCGREIDVVT